MTELPGQMALSDICQMEQIAGDPEYTSWLRAKARQGAVLEEALDSSASQGDANGRSQHLRGDTQLLLEEGSLPCS